MGLLVRMNKPLQITVGYMIAPERYVHIKKGLGELKGPTEEDLDKNVS